MLPKQIFRAFLSLIPFIFLSSFVTSAQVTTIIWNQYNSNLNLFPNINIKAKKNHPPRTYINYYISVFSVKHRLIQQISKIKNLISTLYKFTATSLTQVDITKFDIVQFNNIITTNTNKTTNGGRN